MRLRPISLLRWGLPLAMVAAGIYLFGRSPEGVSEAVISAAVCVVVANAVLRIGFSDAEDRDREERAREFLDEHGHWPDESPDRGEERLGDDRLGDERPGDER